MKWLLVLLAWCCAGQAWGSTRTPFQARCEDTLRKTVSVLTVRQNGYSVDHSLSYTALGEMHGPDTRHPIVLGLTRAESRVSVNVDGPILHDRASGYECVAPHIEVSLYYVPIVVYVARELAPNTCAYKEILAHEMRHLNTYFDYLPKVERVVRAALARRFEARPLYAPTGQARSLLADEVDNTWIPYIKGELAKVEAQQAAIDSPAEYERLSKVCQGEVQLMIRSEQSSKSSR